MLAAGNGGLIHIQGKIPIRCGQGMRTDIQIGHRNRPPACRSQRKASRKTKSIQDLTAIRQSLDAAPVLTLIEIKSRLLPQDHIDFKTDSRFQKHNRFVEWLTPQNLPLSKRPCFGLNVPTHPQDHALVRDLVRNHPDNFIQA